jgi:hypothetical protein
MRALICRTGKTENMLCASFCLINMSFSREIARAASSGMHISWQLAYKELGLGMLTIS